MVEGQQRVTPFHVTSADGTFTLPHSHLCASHDQEVTVACFARGLGCLEAAALPGEIGPAPGPASARPSRTPPHQGPAPRTPTRPFRTPPHLRHRPRGGRWGGLRRHVLRRRDRPPAGQSTGRAPAPGRHSRPGGGRHGHGGGNSGGSWSRCKGSDGPAGWLPDCGPGAVACWPRTALVHSTWDRPGHEALSMGALQGGEEEHGR